MADGKKIGLIIGREWSFPPAFLQEINGRDAGVSAEYVKLGGTVMNGVEFAVKDGIPYAIDFMNAAPDMDINSLTPHYFEWVVKAMADFCIEMALAPRLPRAEHHWAQYLGQYSVV